MTWWGYQLSDVAEMAWVCWVATWFICVHTTVFLTPELTLFCRFGWYGEMISVWSWPSVLKWWVCIYPLKLLTVFYMMSLSLDDWLVSLILSHWFEELIYNLNRKWLAFSALCAYRFEILGRSPGQTRLKKVCKKAFRLYLNSGVIWWDSYRPSLM